MVVIVLRFIFVAFVSRFFFFKSRRRFGEDNDQRLVDFGENPSSFIPPSPNTALKKKKKKKKKKRRRRTTATVVLVSKTNETKSTTFYSPSRRDAANASTSAQTKASKGKASKSFPVEAEILSETK